MLINNIRLYKWKAGLFPWLFFLFGLWYYCFRILGFNFTYIPGDDIDSRFINYLLEHGHRWLFGHDKRFWSGGFMFPFPNEIALSDNMIGSVPIYSIWRIIGCDSEAAYQLWWLSITALNYWACFWVLRQFQLSTISSSIAAWIFAFGLFNLGQLMFTQMNIRFAVPLIFFAAFKLVNTGKWQYLMIYFLTVLFQLSAVLYTGIYAFYGSIVFILIYAFVSKQFNFLKQLFNGSQIIVTITSILLTTALVYALLWPYQEMTKSVGLRLFKEVSLNIPQLPTWLFPHEASFLWSFLFNYTKPVEPEFWLQYVFSGIFLTFTLLGSLIVIVLVITKRINVSIIPLTFIIVASLLFLLNIRAGQNYTFYALIFKLPGINSIRVPARFMNVELFLLVYILAFFINKLNSISLMIITVLIVLDNSFVPCRLTRSLKSDWVERRLLIEKKLDNLKEKNPKPLALIDSTQSPAATHLDAMIYAQQKGISTINGYSSYCPKNFGAFFNHNHSTGLDFWLRSNNISNEAVWIVKIAR